MPAACAPVLNCGPSVRFSRRAGKVGLRNLGNTCFMNAGLQCLSHIEPLAAHFLSKRFESESNPSNPLGCKGELANAFGDLQQALWLSEQGAYDPKRLRARLAKIAPHLFESGDQEDVQEFLAFCLDGLHEDLNRVSVRPPPVSAAQELEDARVGAELGEECAAALAWLRHLQQGRSFLVDLLQGQLRSRVTCLRCGHASRRFDPFLYLSLPVTKAMTQVTDAISKYSEEESLTGDDQWHCERCRMKVDATKKIDLWKLPPVLCLHLKRFEFDSKTSEFVKTENRLSMKLSLLDLQEFCSSPQRDGAIYDVICVANHSGPYGSGHYTAACRVGGLSKGTWHLFDDSRVTQLEGRNIVTRETYVIFLVRSSEQSCSRSSAARARQAPTVRRQTLSRPQCWPHPTAEVTAALSAAGCVTTGDESDAEEIASKAGDGARTSGLPESPPAKRQRTLQEVFAPRARR